MFSHASARGTTGSSSSMRVPVFKRLSDDKASEMPATKTTTIKDRRTSPACDPIFCSARTKNADIWSEVDDVMYFGQGMP